METIVRTKKGKWRMLQTISNDQNTKYAMTSCDVFRHFWNPFCHVVLILETFFPFEICCVVLLLMFFTGSKNTDLNSLKLCDADKASLSSFESATASDIGGVTLKKFSCNAGKQQIIIEYALGAAKKASEPEQTQAKAAQPKNAAKGKTAISQPSSYESVPQVSAHMAESILAMLLQEGVTLDGKEEQLKNKMQELITTPLVALKNTSYTSGFHSNRNQAPTPNFVVRRN